MHVANNGNLTEGESVWSAASSKLNVGEKQALKYPSEDLALRGIVTIEQMVSGGRADECLELNSCAKKNFAAVFIRNDLARMQSVLEGAEDQQ